ncbi:MAG TPA: Asp-tRNA(Asn)/Glu-tRNA(Gln) amidotransferase subunit GatA [Patescibacteria group bacterium]|jgi:aspartyl-tRNA(Asn)/glutamyl-tRNA(Gln) amidotransferase subunit A|nr:Asp-tRNA(Asn)/Glu-tRNA(Gln) amidotransferase subunit GatA [Patescibacteria group bacterium]
MKLNNQTIKQLRQGLKDKQFSSGELVNACLAEIEKRNQNLNAFITVCANQALEQAKKADELIKDGQDLPLLGIPIAIKDIFSTKNVKTTAASKVLSDYVPQYDATVVQKLKSAGAIIIGKTNLDAWAHGSSGENSDFGPTRNPWNEKYVPGGSSSGSAVSVASGMAMAATGTDTGGSIRLPASFTNTVGLKPTYGRVSRYGIIAMASSLDSIGHFTKTVEDSALLLSVTAGQDRFDATTPPENVPNYLKSLSNGVKGLKIGVPKEYITGIEPEILNNFQASLKTLEKLGAEIVNISLPNTESGIAVYYIIQPAEVSSNLARFDGIRYGNDRSFFGNEAKRRIMLGTFTLSVGYYDAYYKKAMRVRTLIIKDFEDAFTKVDAIVSPVSPTKPWKIGEKVNDPLKMYLSDVLTVNCNLAGIPGLSVPSGFINELPVGIQFLGPRFSEELLFRIGHAFEQTTKFYQKSPYEL